MGGVLSCLTLLPVTALALFRHLNEYLWWSKVLRILPAAHLVYPRRADPTVRAKIYSRVPSIAVCPEEPARNDANLHVFLHGTLASPFYHTQLLRASVDRCKHYTLALSYPYSFYSSQKLGRKYMNKFPKEEMKETYAGFYERICFGGDASSLHESITPENSVAGRLKSALMWLAKRFPEEGWEKFMEDGDVVWANVIISGHSQGGSHATYMASRLALKKAVIISAPQGVPFASQSFLSNEFATKDIVALSHAKEDGIASIREGLAVIDPEAEYFRVDESFRSNVEGDNNKFFLSSIQPRAPYLPRKYHVSTATNVGSRPIYEETIWPMLFRV